MTTPAVLHDSGTNKPPHRILRPMQAIWLVAATPAPLPFLFLFFLFVLFSRMQLFLSWWLLLPAPCTSHARNCSRLAVSLVLSSSLFLYSVALSFGIHSFRFSSFVPSFSFFSILPFYRSFPKHFKTLLLQRPAENLALPYLQSLFSLLTILSQTFNHSQIVNSILVNRIQSTDGPFKRLAAAG